MLRVGFTHTQWLTVFAEVQSDIKCNVTHERFGFMFTFVMYDENITVVPERNVLECPPSEEPND